ncbi:hypothetical protein R3P38DRAFT_2814251 [Favolaschia claudopus]|uniref:Uncharacterized protein n=1 Tax=Favolaschia claudopus TaxID=2862362 RepID=A0AAV9Z370_9AGAR
MDVVPPSCRLKAPPNDALAAVWRQWRHIHPAPCWRTGMTVIPRAYRLKRKAQKLAALRKATAEYSQLRAQRKYHDIDGDTLVAGSRRQSAQMLDFDVDELA